MFYLKDGTPCDGGECGQKSEDWRYKTIGHTHIGEALVSTTWVGIDYNCKLSERGPLMFETMVLGGKHAYWCARHYTEAEAEACHLATVLWLAGHGDEPTGADE